MWDTQTLRGSCNGMLMDLRTILNFVSPSRILLIFNAVNFLWHSSEPNASSISIHILNGTHFRCDVYIFAFSHIHQWRVAANWPVNGCRSAEWWSNSGMFFNGVNDDQLKYYNGIDGIDDQHVLCNTKVCDGRKTTLPLPFAAFRVFVNLSLSSFPGFNFKHVFHQFGFLDRLDRLVLLGLRVPVMFSHYVSRSWAEKHFITPSVPRRKKLRRQLGGLHKRQIFGQAELHDVTICHICI